MARLTREEFIKKHHGTPGEELPPPPPLPPPLEVDWGQRFRDVLGAADIPLKLTGVWQGKDVFDELAPGLIPGQPPPPPEGIMGRLGEYSGFSPMSRAFSAEEEFAGPAHANFLSMFNPEVQRRIRQQREAGAGPFAGAQQGYELAKEAGEVPWWQQYPTEILGVPSTVAGGTALKALKLPMKAGKLGPPLRRLLGNVRRNIAGPRERALARIDEAPQIPARPSPLSPYERWRGVDLPTETALARTAASSQPPPRFSVAPGPRQTSAFTKAGGEQMPWRDPTRSPQYDVGMREEIRGYGGGVGEVDLPPAQITEFGRPLKWDYIGPQRFKPGGGPAARIVGPSGRGQTPAPPAIQRADLPPIVSPYAQPSWRLLSQEPLGRVVGKALNEVDIARRAGPSHVVPSHVASPSGFMGQGRAQMGIATPKIGTKAVGGSKEAAQEAAVTQKIEKGAEGRASVSTENWKPSGIKPMEGTAEEIQGYGSSWVARLGSSEQKAAVIKFFAALDKLPKIKSDKLKDLQLEAKKKIGAEKGRRVGSGTAEAEGKEGIEGKVKAFTSKQAGPIGTIPKNAIDRDALIKALGGQKSYDEIVAQVKKVAEDAGPIGNEGPLPKAQRNPDYILRPWEHTHLMNATRALVDHGHTPTASNMRLLDDVFGSNVSEVFAKKRPGTLGRTGWTLKEILLDVFSAPRANVSSVDLSYLMRQASLAMPRFAKQAGEAFEISLKALRDPIMLERMELAMKQAEGGALWGNYVEGAGLFMHRAGRTTTTRLMGQREEAFTSTLAGKYIPWVRVSERAYVVFLNKLRFDIMDYMVKQMEHAMFKSAGKARKLTYARGEKFAGDREILESIAEYVEAMTGRGPGIAETVQGAVGIAKTGLRKTGFIGEENIADDLIDEAGELMTRGRRQSKYVDEMSGMQSAMRTSETIMNALMFSPRLFTSRIAAPAYAARNMGGVVGLYPSALADDVVAKAAYKQMSRTVATQMASWIGMGMTFIGLAYTAEKAGLPISVGVNPNSSEFGKVRVGNSRFDIWAGYSQIARAAVQTYTGKRTSASTGVTREVSRLDVLQLFARSKFNPSFGMLSEYNLLGPLSEGEGFGTGTGFLGEDRDILRDMKRIPWGGLGEIEETFWARFFMPLFLRDLTDAIDNELTPIFPEDVDSFGYDRRDPPSLATGIAKGVVTALPGLFGVGITTFTTLDDIAAEMTKDPTVWKHGPMRYSDLPRQLKIEAREIQKMREAEEGTTRTASFGGRMDALREKEQRRYEGLATERILTSEIRRKYWKIKQEIDEEENALRAEVFGVEGQEAFKESQMGVGTPASLKIDEFWATYDLFKESRPSKTVSSTEYAQLIRDWESRMFRSSDEVDRAAVLLKRMQEYLTPIPPALLRRLSPYEQRRYRSAQDLRAQYKEGNLPKELYGG